MFCILWRPWLPFLLPFFGLFLAMTGRDGQSKEDVLDTNSAANTAKSVTAATKWATEADQPAASSPQRRPMWLRLLLIVMLPVLLSAGAGYLYRRPATQHFFMRFFRDLSRAKAHRRLHGDMYGLTVFASMDEPLQLLELRDDGLRFTREELATFDGQEGRPTYICIRGRVYDVSASPSFYGKGRSYHRFVGRDATRAFGTACTQNECLVSSTVGLDADQLREVDRWLDFYERHDKYRYVGQIIRDPVEEALQATQLEEEAIARALGDAATGSPLEQARRLHARASNAYRGRDLDGAISLWSSALVALGPILDDHPDQYPVRGGDRQALGQGGADGQSETRKKVEATADAEGDRDGDYADAGSGPAAERNGQVEVEDESKVSVADNVETTDVKRNNRDESVELRAGIMLGMSAVELKRGNAWQAQESYAETLAGLLQGLGPERALHHPLVCRARADSGTCLYLSKKFSAARLAFEQALACYEGAMGADAVSESAGGNNEMRGMAPLRANTRLNLAVTLVDMSELAAQHSEENEANSVTPSAARDGGEKTAKQLRETATATLRVLEEDLIAAQASSRDVASLASVRARASSLRSRLQNRSENGKSGS